MTKASEYEAVMKKLAEFVDKDVTVFDEDEVAEIRELIRSRPTMEEMIEAWEMVQAWRSLGKMLIWLLITAAAVTAAYRTVGELWR